MQHSDELILGFQGQMQRSGHSIRVWIQELTLTEGNPEQYGSGEFESVRKAEKSTVSPIDCYVYFLGVRQRMRLSIDCFGKRRTTHTRRSLDAQLLDVLVPLGVLWARFDTLDSYQLAGGQAQSVQSLAIHERLFR